MISCKVYSEDIMHNMLCKATLLETYFDVYKQEKNSDEKSLLHNKYQIIRSIIFQD